MFYVHYVLSISQVEVKAVNTVLLQNLSSLSRYLVSVQSLYEKGLSTPITANVTTCKLHVFYTFYYVTLIWKMLICFLIF